MLTFVAVLCSVAAAVAGLTGYILNIDSKVSTLLALASASVVGVAVLSMTHIVELF